jgi:hypothetical protein
LGLQAVTPAANSNKRRLVFIAGKNIFIRVSKALYKGF